jgi:polyphosphate glucokinase
MRKVLVIDIGGTNVKVLATGQKESHKFPSGPKMTPRRMVAGVKQLVADGNYDVVSIGYPGRHLSYKKGTCEDYLGAHGLQRLGRRKWQGHHENCVARLIFAFHLDDVVIGGGNASKLIKLPKGCRAGDNANAFLGGFRLWRRTATPHPQKRKTKPRLRVRRDPPRPNWPPETVPSLTPTPNLTHQL